MEAFNIYSFSNSLKSITLNDFLEMAFLPFCILACAVIIGLALNKLLVSIVEKHFGDEEESMRYVLLRATRGLPMTWVVGSTLYWLINSIDLHHSIAALLSLLLLTVLTFNIFQALARGITGAVDLYARRNSHLPRTTFLTNVLNVIIYGTGLLLFLGSMGISIAPLLTALGVGGMAIALGLQEPLANICAGLYLLVSKQLRMGDYVRLSTGEEGKVEDITWRFTTIIANSGNAVVIPNQKISSAVIINYNMPEPDMALRIPCGVAYDSDLEKVEAVTIEVAKKIMQEYAVETKKEPAVFFHTFGESSIDFTIILHCNEFSQQFKIKHEFIKALTARYRQENINIPYPIRTVYLNSPGEK